MKICISNIRGRHLESEMQIFMRYVCEINRNITGEARFFLNEMKQVKTQKNAC